MNVYILSKSTSQNRYTEPRYYEPAMEYVEIIGVFASFDLAREAMDARKEFWRSEPGFIEDNGWFGDATDGGPEDYDWFTYNIEKWEVMED